MHLRFDKASAVIATPSSPDGSAEALRRASGFVSGNRPGAVRLPGLAIPPRMDDCIGDAGSNGVMALAGVEGTISSDFGNLLIGWDLVD